MGEGQGQILTREKKKQSIINSQDCFEAYPTVSAYGNLPEALGP
jgi:hypothetical protein